jgi:isoleucyl-tRNA synthetase
MRVYIWQVSSLVENYVNKMLESKMQKAQTISSLVLSPVKKEMIKVRQQKVMIPVLDESELQIEFLTNKG